MSGIQKQYVKALVAILHSGADVGKTIKHLREVMMRRGHLRLLPAVLRSLSKELAAKERSAAPKLIVAKEEDVKQYATQAKGTEVVVDPNIIGGYILTKDHSRTDTSYKTRLLNWYKTAVNS